MSFQPRCPPYLHREMSQWLARNRGWYLRPLEYSDDDQYAVSWMLPAYRHADASEVAEDIVNDPELREALSLLASPPGQVIEQAVAQLWLSPLEAELLTDGLTQAWRIVLDQNRPAWQRADVLAGTGIFLAVIGMAIWANRRAA
jgi:hypothetical protein